MRPSLYRVSAFFVVILTLMISPIQGAAMTSSFQIGPSTPPERPKYVDREILVKFRPEVREGTRDAIHKELGGRVLYEVPGIEWQVVEVPAGTEPEKVEAYRANLNVKAAERNGYLQALWTPNDPCFGEQWGLHNTGAGNPGADIDAPQAWEVERGDPAVRIAIVDTGVDLDHPDLADKIVAHVDCVDGTCDTGPNAGDDDSVDAEGNPAGHRICMEPQSGAGCGRRQFGCSGFAISSRFSRGYRSSGSSK